MVSFSLSKTALPGRLIIAFHPHDIQVDGIWMPEYAISRGPQTRSAGSAVLAGRHLERAQRGQRRGFSLSRLVVGVRHVTVAKALEHLAEPQQTIAPRPPQ